MRAPSRRTLQQTEPVTGDLVARSSTCPSKAPPATMKLKIGGKGLRKGMVGLGGLEPPTSPLSGARSSHLSYRPNVKQLGNFSTKIHCVANASWAKFPAVRF